MRSDPLIIVTCEDPDGCDSREEIVLPLDGRPLEPVSIETFVTLELDKRGWIWAAMMDLCESCGEKWKAGR